MKWLLMAVVPIAFVAGFLLGRKTAPVAPAEVALPAPAPKAAPAIAAPVTPAIALAQPATEKAEDLAQQAQEVYVKGQYKKAIELTTRAIERNPKEPLALRILGAAQCKTRNRDGAIKAYRAADPQFRNFIKFVCHTEGIELP